MRRAGGRTPRPKRPSLTRRPPPPTRAPRPQDYARAMCALLDIPVYGSLTQPLHVLFTLYLEFSGNVHFAGREGGAGGAGGSAAEDATGLSGA